MKYVVFSGYNGEQIIIFPKIIQHSVMADDVKKSSFGGMRPVSGGFIIDGECVGESESLRMQSRGDIDTALIKEMLCLDDEPEAEVIQIVPVCNSTMKNRAKRLRRGRK